MTALTRAETIAKVRAQAVYYIQCEMARVCRDHGLPGPIALGDRLSVTVDDEPGPGPQRLLVRVRLSERRGASYIIAKCVVPRLAHVDTIDNLLMPGLAEAAALVMDGWYPE